MKSLFKASVFAAACTLIGASSSFAMLAVDFGTSTSPVESGFTGVSSVGPTGIGSIGGSPVSLSITTGTTPGTFGTGDKGGPDALNRDWIKSTTSSNSAGDFIDLVLSGVPAGSYTFTGFFHLTDPSTGQYANAETLVALDGAPKLSVVRSEGTETPASGSFNFSTDGSGDLTFSVTLADANKRPVLINGFTLAAVPEAGAFLVWSMLSGVAVVRYRGKRRA